MGQASLDILYICNLDNVVDDYIPSQIHTQSVKNKKTKTTNTHKSNLRTSKKELAKNKKNAIKKRMKLQFGTEKTKQSKIETKIHRFFRLVVIFNF